MYIWFAIYVYRAICDTFCIGSINSGICPIFVIFIKNSRISDELKYSDNFVKHEE
jgi:hypothetical protein